MNISCCFYHSLSNHVTMDAPGSGGFDSGYDGLATKFIPASYGGSDMRVIFHWRSWCVLAALSLTLIPRLNAQAAEPSSGAASPPFQDLSARAAADRDAGKTEEAIREYQDALKLRPTWTEGWWYLGTTNYDADHYADAIPAFEHLLKINAKLGPGWGFLGLCEFEVHRYDAAFHHLERAHGLGFAEDPEITVVANYHLALLLNLRGEFEKAEALLAGQFAQTDFPEQAKTALGLALLRVPLLPSQVDPSKDAVIHAAGEAAALLAKQNLEQGIAALEKMLKDFPGTPYLHYAYGNALASQGKLGEALGQMREETQRQPDSPSPYVRISSIALKLNHPQESLRAARKAVQLAPNSAAAHEALAHSLYASGQLKEAADEQKTARNFASAPPQIDSGIAQFYARALLPRTGSEPSAQNSAETNAQSAAEIQRLAQQALAASQRGDIPEAISDYESGVALDPRWGDGWRALGTLRYMSQQYHEAIPALENSLAIDANHSEAWALLGLSEFAEKDYENALLHLQRGYEMGFAGDANAVRLAKYHLALLLNLKGQFERAEDLLMPEVGANAFGEAANSASNSIFNSLNNQIKTALGLSLLHLALLPEQVSAAQQSLVRSAGEAAGFVALSKYDDAFVVFQQMLKAHPDTAYLHYAYGKALAALSRYDDAAVQMREETRISPESPLPHLGLASIALQLHHPADAVTSAQRALQLDSSSADGHYSLGRAFLELGNAPDAVKELQVASKLAPNSPQIHFNLARAYAKTGHNEEAAQERATFQQLNDELQRQRSGQKSQAYGAAYPRSPLN